MERPEKNQKRPAYLKRKLTSALCMLLISSILMATSSYAWLVMSTAPEVSGITTSIGANGSLEIALLTTETRQNMSAIRTGIGESLANHVTTANNTWGNLVDLSNKSYGLSNITLLPARINATPKSDGAGYVVDTGMLAIPTYGYDGRIIDLTDDTISAVYSGEKFNYAVGAQDYGVRAIGTADDLSVQGSALAMAKSNIATYANSANSTAASALDSNGQTLFSIVLNKAMAGSGISVSYGDTELNGLKAVLAGLQSSATYIELALRQGIVAVAASQIADEDTFVLVRDTVLDTSKSLTDIFDDENAQQVAGDMPEEFTNWVAELADIQNSLNAASNSANALTGGSYSWEEFKDILNYIMNTDLVYINDTLFPDFSVDQATELIGGTVVLTLAPGSGVPADIADFADNFSAGLTAMGTEVQITTSTTAKPVYLFALSEAVKDLEAADEAEGEGAEKIVELSTTYGYALDLAFRCNAPAADLLLQTTPQQRVYGDSVSASTMGGGSFMEFTCTDANFSLEQMLKLMDAVRVGFLDDQGNLLRVAKLNTSNRVIVDRVIKASLYLYDYTFSEEDGAMLMGERQKVDNTIVSLEQNVPKALTAIVWLDGDEVDNTMVPANAEAALTGTLNLQFATNANLIPASNKELLNITSDKSALNLAVEEMAKIVEQGQLTYTTESWNAFMAAYNYAVAVKDNGSATDSQIYNSALHLAEAKEALQMVSKDTLSAAIAELRQTMGKTEDLARYVVVDEETGAYKAVNPYTQEQQDNKVGEITAVDYAKNLRDEGNEVFTPVYTDGSWSALADALYSAEAVEMDPNATDLAIDNALLAMAEAEKALAYAAYFIPYEFNDGIYYMAISEETDTYGKWYTSDFKRVFADKTILDLDAHAEYAAFASIDQSDYVSNSYARYISPYAMINAEVYPELQNEEIKALSWTISSDPDGIFDTGSVTHAQLKLLGEKVNEARAAGVAETDARLVNAEALLTLSSKRTPEEVANAIAGLEAAIVEVTPETPEVPEDPNAVKYMTDNQRIVLTAAINSAKSVEGYEVEEEETPDAQAEGETETETQPEVDKLAALRAAVAAAQAVLDKGDSATEAEAATALTNLNTQLTAHGKKAVTEYNTITYEIPLGSERYEVVYETEFPNTLLWCNGTRGAANIRAVMLTKNGVVYEMFKTVNVYSKADDVDITYSSVAPAGGKVTENLDADGKFLGYIWNRVMETGAQTEVGAMLLPRVEYVDVKDEEGNVTGTETVKLPMDETIVKRTWASSDTKVLTVSDTGVIKAVGGGSARVSISVETLQGNVYTDEILVNVVAAPAAEPTT